MSLDKRVKTLEQKVKLLEQRVTSGRPPKRFNLAKEYLKEKLRGGKAMPIRQVVDEGDFNQQLLSKARKELGYDVFVQQGIWYWKAL